MDSTTNLMRPTYYYVEDIFKKCNNLLAIFILAFQTLSLISLLIVAIVLPLETFDYSESLKEIKFDEYAIIYAHIIIGCMVVISEKLLQHFYFRKLQINGYHKHHNQVIWMTEVPKISFSLSNIFLIVSILLFHSNPKFEVEWLKMKVSDISDMLIISIFTAVNIPFTVSLFISEIRFRMSRGLPDVFRMEDSNQLQRDDTISSVGISSTTLLEDLLEKQADLIYNLTNQNNQFRRMLYNLNERLENGHLESY